MKNSKSKSFFRKLGVLAIACLFAVGCGSEARNDALFQSGGQIQAGPPSGVLVSLNNGTNNISSFTIADLANGTPVQTAGSPAALVASPAEMAIRKGFPLASRSRVYYTNLNNSTINTFDLNSTSGILAGAGTPINTATAGAFGIAIDSGNNHLYVAGDVQVDGFNLSTNPVTQLAGFPVATNAAAGAGSLNRLKLSNNGMFLYVADRTGNQIYGFLRDAGTGGLTAIAGSPFATGLAFVDDLELTTNDGLLYVASDDGGIAGFSVDATTGALTPLAPALTVTHNGALHAAANACGMLVNGSTLYISDSQLNTTDAFSIAANGALTQLTGFPVAGGGCGPVLGSNSPTALAPIYLAGFNANQIFGFMPGANGSLTTLTGTPINTGAGSNPASLGIILP